MRYRKIPVTIEAYQWTTEGFEVRDDAPQWFYDALTEGTLFFDGDELYVNTLEGEMHASEGDYIIKGIRGELYPCKPDVFAKTYEAVE